MATIIEGGVWLLSEEVAERMVESGLIFKCPHGDHIHQEEISEPVYHRHHKAPDWFGHSTMRGAIAGAEKAIGESENVGNEEATKPTE